jgi:hypothetical protein
VSRCGWFTIFFEADGSGFVIVLRRAPPPDSDAEYQAAVAELEANGFAYVVRGHGPRGDADDLAILT